MDKKLTKLQIEKIEYKLNADYFIFRMLHFIAGIIFTLGISFVIINKMYFMGLSLFLASLLTMVFLKDKLNLWDVLNE